MQWINIKAVSYTHLDVYKRQKKINDVGKVRHNFVPYLECFSQINSKYRMETALAWRIAPNDRFMTVSYTHLWQPEFPALPEFFPIQC